MRKTINATLTRLVMRYRRKDPHAGIRGIAAILKDKHAISISKSTVSSILKTRKVNSLRGRKQHLLLYRRRLIRGCGLLLLRCVDHEVGLLENLCNELRVYFPKIKPRLLEKMILFLAFNAYLKRGTTNIREYREFLKIADLYSLPARTVKYFMQKVTTHAPAITLGETKNNLQLVSTIKFHFGNGYTGFCDAKMTTFWDDPCYVETFFSSKYAVLKRIEFIEKHNLLYIYYTKSFDQFSPLVIDFLRSIPTGIKKIEILGRRGEILWKKDLALIKPSFFIGYYPRIVTRGFTFLEKGGNFKKLNLACGDVLYCSVITRFIHPKTKQATITNNILLKNKKKMLPSWGVLTNKKSNTPAFLRQYLLFWPFMEKVFLEQMKTIEASYFTGALESRLDRFIPEELVLATEEDFTKITEILAKIFIERFGNIDFSTTGEYTVGKDSCSIMLSGMDPRLKEKFNNACLYVRDKRTFLF